MAELDAPQIAENALRFGLISTDQIQEGWEEIGQRGGEAQAFLRAMERKGYLTPWQSQKLLKNDPDGYFLGGYRILYKIASGSFGRVYRGDDPRTGTIVAVKVLRRKWSDDKHHIEMFEREGKVGMAMKHPNVVEILAVNRDAVTGQYYIVMEFVEGGNLREILKIRKKLQLEEAVRMLEDAAAGLAYAYSRGVSHRDMKMTNILVASTGNAKLVDFGLADVYGKMAQQESNITDRTVDYAGLEKATNAPDGDIRSDIYFLGCVAYEMLTGMPPLDAAKDARARMMAERFRSVKPIEESGVELPQSMARLVDGMMAFQPDKRFQTPSQLSEAIRDVRRQLEKKDGDKNENRIYTIFIAERNEKLQDLMREKFKKHGFRVLLAADPTRALDRFRQQPYDAIVVDAKTTGEDGVVVFDQVLEHAAKRGEICAGVVILGEDQKDWVKKIKKRPNIAGLVHPVSFKKLLSKINSLLGLAGE